MSKFVTATHQSNKLGKIHYIEEVNGQLDNLAHCSLVGPWEPTATTYKDRYEGRICKKCFKAYISSLNENESGGES
jgi:hypothetical protein